MKRLTALLLITVAFAMVASCAPVSPPRKEAREEVTIRFMHMWPAAYSAQQNRIVNRIVDEYKAQNPHINIKIEVLENESYKEKLKILSASNKLPDVGVTWAAGFLEPYVIGRRFAVLDDLLVGDLRDKFFPGTTEAYQVGGKVYALPLEVNIVPIFYNKKIFAEHGLQVPESYEEFKQAVTVLSEGGIVPIALGNRDRWPGSLWYMYLADRLGGPTAFRDAIRRWARFNVPPLIEAAREIQELVDMNAFSQGFNGMSSDDSKNYFVSGRAAMYMMGTWELPNMIIDSNVSSEFKENLGYFKFPLVDGNTSDINSWVGGPGVGLFVSEDSPVKAEAKRFVRYFVGRWGELSIKEAGIFPATKVNMESVNMPQIYIDLLNELYNASNLTLYADVAMKPAAAEMHLTMIQSLYGKVITPEQFANVHESVLESGGLSGTPVQSP